MSSLRMTILGVSRDHRGNRWVRVRYPDGNVVEIEPEFVPMDVVRAYQRAWGARLGDMVDDIRAQLGRLIDDFQAQGREWFLARILDLNAAESRHRENRDAAQSIGRADLVQEAEGYRQSCRTVRDNCYWIVDTYLGGVDALPNVVPARAAGPRPPVPQPRRDVRLGPAGIILGGIGIVSGAALLAWIADVIRVADERRALIAAAKETGDTTFLEPLKAGGDWKFWAGAGLVVAGLIWGPGVVRRLSRSMRTAREAVRG